MALVTLTSDFGTSDGYVGAMKGVILSRAPGAHIVDIAHDVPRCNIAHGAYCLSQAARYFPPGTIHVAVVDPGVGTERRAVIVDSGGHLFVGPNNGVLSMSAPAPRAVHAIESPAFMRPDVSATFHGRDVFAAAAGQLAAGADPADAGPRVSLSPPAWNWVTAGERMAVILHVDHFGNLITGMDASRVPEKLRIEVSGRVVDRLSRTFGEVPVGQLVAYIGSAGTLELAIREDSAARVLGLAAGDAITIA